MKLTLLSASLAVAAFLSGCASPAPVAGVEYPATYSIRLAERSDGGGSAAPSTRLTQEVRVVPRELLYYRLSSPVDVTVSVYEFDAQGQRTLLGQMRGTSFTTSVMPTNSRVEFDVRLSAQPATSGLVQFTVSDQPIAAGHLASATAE